MAELGVDEEPADVKRSAESGRTHLRGIALVTAAFLVMPALDGIAKFLIADMHVVQVVWGRLFFSIAGGAGLVGSYRSTPIRAEVINPGY